MASAAQIYTMIQTVVEGHATHNTFYSIWNPAKDDPSQVQYPCVIEHRYIGKVVENTDLGIRYRSQLVQLLVITTVSTERTVALSQKLRWSPMPPPFMPPIPQP